MRNPLVPNKAKALNTINLPKSAGILDDYAIRKNIATREGTIEKVPVNDSDIVNLKYLRNRPKEWNFTIIDPNGVYNIDTHVFIAHVQVDIVITKIHVELDAVTNQVAGDLVHMPNFIAHPAATTIVAFDTTAGKLEQDVITSPNVAAGRHVALSFDSEPHADIKQMHVTIFYYEV